MLGMVLINAVSKEMVVETLSFTCQRACVLCHFHVYILTVTLVCRESWHYL